MSKQPNVLMFIPHDLGDYLNCYDHSDIVSPNLDRMAEDGVKFTSYFAVAPECTASRSSMLMGTYTHQNGLEGLAGMGWELHEPEKHLASRLRDNGYETCLFGLQHETSGPSEKLGYMNCFTESKKVGDVCDAVNNFLQQRKDQDTPWFIHAGFTDVHRPWPETTTFKPEDVILPSYLPDLPEVRRDYTLFYQNIMEMDAAVGRVIDELDRLGLRDDTLIVFTTDHGSPFPRAKATFYDPGIRIPLIMSHPSLGSGKTISALCSNLDYSPTIMDFCKKQVPSDIEGISMMPLLTGERESLRTEVFGAMYYDVSYDPMYYVRTEEFKYIRSFGVDKDEAAGADPRVLAAFKAGQWIRFDDYDVMTSLTWKAMEHPCLLPPKEELYDLKSDPLELNNLAADLDYAEVLEEMRDLLGKMLHDTNSPLPEKHIQPPQAQVDASKRYGEMLNLDREKARACSKY